MTPVTGVNVVMYGQKDCSRCEEVKKALKANGVFFSYEDIRFLNDPEFNPDWRENGAVELLAEVNLKGWTGDLPLLVVDGDIVLAADAEEVTIEDKVIPMSSKVHCEGGSCKVNFAAPVKEEAAVAVA